MRTLSPEEFAIRLHERDLEGMFTKEARVPEGALALLFVENKYDGTLSPGVHKLEGAGIGALFGRSRMRSVVLVRSTDIGLDFLISRLLTKDPLYVGLECGLVVKLRPGGETAFAINVMSGKDSLDMSGLRSLLFGEVKEVARSWASRHSMEELADNLELKQQLAYDIEAHLEYTFQRYGLSFSGIQTSNFCSESWDEAKEMEADVFAQTEKAVLYEKRAQVWKRLSLAANSEKMNQITSEQELEDFIREADKDKLLKEADYEHFKRNLVHTLDDQDRARAHMVRLAEMEREYELKRADFSGRHSMSQQEVEAEIGLERLRVEWALDIELKKADLELDKERHRAEMELELEDRAATQERRQQVELRRADIEAEEQRQGLELQQQQEKHRLELDKLREMDRLSIQGLIAISGDSKAPLLAELARTESMKGLSVEQILAMAAEKKPEVAQSLSELASGAGSEEQKQLYERLLSEQKDSQKQTREDHREFIQIQKQMFQDTMDTLSQIAQANARGQGPPLAAPGVGATSPQPGSPPPGTPERVVVCRCCLAESPVGTKYCPNCGDSLTGRE